MVDDTGTPGDASPGRGEGRAAVAPTLVAAILAAAAGAVDAVCFDRVFGVFPANQSGNAVLLGIGLGNARGSEAWRPALAIVGFAVGVAGALLLGSRLPRRRRPETLLAVELALLLPLAVVLLGTDRPRTELDGGATALLLLLTTAAMGIQTEVIGRAAGVAVATTYQSGAIVRIAELATGGRGAHRSGATRSIGVLVVVLGAYVGGAALGAALGSFEGALFVPIGMLLVVIVVAAVGGDAFGPRARAGEPPAP